jgi:DNA-directed RNA polymerase
MRQRLINSITRRIKKEIAPQNPVKFLMDHSVDDYIDILISVVYLYTRPKRGEETSIYMAEVITAMGHKVRSKLKKPRDSALAAKSGAFLLYSFEELELLYIKLGQGSRGHAAYILEIIDDNGICELWQSIDARGIEKIPSVFPYLPWKGVKHSTGMSMIKTQDKDVLKAIDTGKHWMLFDCLNKAQKVGWRINEDIYKIHLWALRNKTDAFADIWEQHNPEAKATKLREARAVGDIAKKFIGKTFYHLYYYDFRGRKYAATAYLHEQGADLARGFLLREEKKELGTEGLFWLTVSIASNWAGDAGREDGLKTDKIPLKHRNQWVLDNEEILLSYAESPKVNQGWMKADKPWQFIAACNELMKFREYQSEILERLPEGLSCSEEMMHGYESHLECFIDGSNNGCQHLTALTLDEHTAPHVNLVPLEYPGDLYRYVAENVWRALEKEVLELSVSELIACEELIDKVIGTKRRIAKAPATSELRQRLIDELMEFKWSNPELLTIAAAVYWYRVKDTKERRKIVKRNTMTLPYGGTPYGLGQQIIDDAKKHGIDLLMYLEHKWGAYLGREIHDNCKVSMKRPMQLLTVFEKAGKEAEASARFLSWTVPVTNFPVCQHYTHGKVKKTWVRYGPPKGNRTTTGYFGNDLQLHICYLEDTIPSKRKQAQGASPNAIHSLDAAHLMMTVCKANFPVTTVHDSFGCLLADMPDLFKIVRETFVELYETDPLTSIMSDINGDLSGIQKGNLDIKSILESEYCFS